MAWATEAIFYGRRNRGGGDESSHSHNISVGPSGTLASPADFFKQNRPVVFRSQTLAPSFDTIPRIELLFAHRRSKIFCAPPPPPYSSIVQNNGQDFFPITDSRSKIVE